MKRRGRVSGKRAREETAESWEQEAEPEKRQLRKLGQIQKRTRRRKTVEGSFEREFVSSCTLIHLFIQQIYQAPSIYQELF